MVDKTHIVVFVKQDELDKFMTVAKEIFGVDYMVLHHMDFEVSMCINDVSEYVWRIDFGTHSKRYNAIVNKFLNNKVLNVEIYYQKMKV